MAASDDTLAMAVDEDEDEAHHHPYYNYCSHNLSRLSMCTTQQRNNTSGHHEDDDDDDDGGVTHDMGIYMAGLSMDGSNGEHSDKGLVSGASSESDDNNYKESGSTGSFSLPGTPPRQRRRRNNGGFVSQINLGEKDYASENEAKKAGTVKKRWMRRRNWWRRGVFSREGSSAWKKTNTRLTDGERECMLITTPKGGRRSLCMDLEEVKACKDLGFELGRISLSCSPVDTSSGGNSPVGNSNWRVSSPGDDPRDVKAKLKVWAQAVALASATR